MAEAKSACWRLHAARRIKALLARLALALLLLGGQQHAELHWLSHALEATRSGAPDAPAHDDHCETCAALTAFAAALPTAVAAPPARDELTYAVVAPAQQDLLRALACASYEPRAPPLA